MTSPGRGSTGAELYLFDDRQARRWSPFRLTRPVGELLFGCFLLRERAERFFGAKASGHLAGRDLVGFEESGSPPVVEPPALPRDPPRVLLSSRAVLADGEAPGVDEAATLVVEGRPAGWILPPGEAAPDEATLLDPEESPQLGRRIELRGRLLAWPWDLVEANASQIAEDVEALHGRRGGFRLTDVKILGDHVISVGVGVEVEPGVVLDAREGPLRFDDGVRVQAPARLAGPLYVGRGTLLYGGTVNRSSIGPVCKVRGEVDTSVVTGHANKAHDGYLGHALLGRWVNLGALTTNSDLKNNYAPVRVRLGDEQVDTGLLKVGCFIGDHVKTGIGTLLNTGAVIGAGSNVFGGLMCPVHVPPFSWGAGEQLVEFRLEKFIEVARAAMARRDVELTDGMRELLARAWEATRGEREAAGAAPRGS